MHRCAFKAKQKRADSHSWRMYEMCKEERKVLEMWKMDECDRVKYKIK